jgi:EAL domain-containing protein (putative c-di-GMP-specific phosphodiesterase class I)
VGFAVTEASSGREAHEALDVLGTRLDLLVCAASLPPGPASSGADVVAYARATAPASQAILAADILDAREESWTAPAPVLWMPLSGATLACHALDLLGSRAGAVEPASTGTPDGGSGEGTSADCSSSVSQAVAVASPPGMQAAAEARTPRSEAATGPDFDESLRHLYVLFQPIVQADNGTPYGYEALMRSRGPCRSAADLLAAAEHLGRMEELGRAVRRLVAQAIEDNAGIHGTIFVNIHPRELDAGILLRDDEPLLPFANRIAWEVIERERIASPADLGATLRALRTAGFRLAIDDLGDGYASLSWLVALVPDVAKIDLSLVRDIDQSRIKRDLVGAIVSVCRRIGTIVVAECVETVEEAAVLRDLGCDLLQGHLYARPSPPFSEAQ